MSQFKVAPLCHRTRPEQIHRRAGNVLDTATTGSSVSDQNTESAEYERRVGAWPRLLVTFAVVLLKWGYD